MLPSPTAMATSMAGGAWREAPADGSTARGEKSPARAANKAISDSEMVRRRVVHSPPSARSSKEVGSSSPEYSPQGGGHRNRPPPQVPALTYLGFPRVYRREEGVWNFRRFC